MPLLSEVKAIRSGITAAVVAAGVGAMVFSAAGVGCRITEAAGAVGNAVTALVGPDWVRRMLADEAVGLSDEGVERDGAKLRNNKPAPAKNKNKTAINPKIATHIQGLFLLAGFAGLSSDKITVDVSTSGVEKD